MGGEDRREGDQGGHIIGDRFGGVGGFENLIPMTSKLNQGDYKRMENDLAKAVADGKTVFLRVDMQYDGDSQRPSGLTAVYTIDGEMTKRDFSNS